MVELQSDLEYVVTDRLKVSLDAIAQKPKMCDRHICQKSTRLRN
ncbi:hypothetical protein [Microcoleus sp.]